MLHSVYWPGVRSYNDGVRSTENMALARDTVCSWFLLVHFPRMPGLRAVVSMGAASLLQLFCCGLPVWMGVSSDLSSLSHPRVSQHQGRAGLTQRH